MIYIIIGIVVLMLFGGYILDFIDLILDAFDGISSLLKPKKVKQPKKTWKKIVIDANDCVGCGACEDVCPTKAISIKNDVAYCDHLKCVLCMRCIKECPMDCIKVIEES